MPETTRGFPYPAPTDRPDVPRDIQALAESVDGYVAGTGVLTGGAAASQPESTGSPSAFVTLHSFPVVAGRRYAVDVFGLVIDAGTTTTGTGWSVEAQATGAGTIGVTAVGRGWNANNSSSAIVSFSRRLTFTATTDGTVTVSARITRLSAAGRPTLTSCRADVSA